METIMHELSDIKTVYNPDENSKISDYLFVDIETTGFTPRTSKLYLIGCVYGTGSALHTTQFFANRYSDEAEVLEEFCDFSKNFKYLVHFNGNNFDIPYLKAKCKEFNIEPAFENLEGIDVFRRITPYKTFLRLENCKQKTIEKFLGIKREDKFSGGDLIGLYHSYVANNDEELKKLLLLHNYEDIKGMVEILPVLAFTELFNRLHTVTKVSANYFEDEQGNKRSELLIAFELEKELPVPVSFIYDTCYFTGAANHCMIKVPLYEEEMKYFYADYEDYYYLPAEDIALHKSVSSFVEKSHREQAKASNCYTRKFSKYLPEWDTLVTPFFKRDYKSGELFFELTDELKTDREFFSRYVSHILNHMSM
jgi:uncharacterized protein YprB with RNaseH-like and TPR domain